MREESGDGDQLQIGKERLGRSIITATGSKAIGAKSESAMVVAAIDGKYS
jgi:hypothetical protein